MVQWASDLDCRQAACSPLFTVGFSLCRGTSCSREAEGSVLDSEGEYPAVGLLGGAELCRECRTAALRHLVQGYHCHQRELALPDPTGHQRGLVYSESRDPCEYHQLLATPPRCTSAPHTPTPHCHPHHLHQSGHCGFDVGITWVVCRYSVAFQSHTLDKHQFLLGVSLLTPTTSVADRTKLHVVFSSTATYFTHWIKLKLTPSTAGKRQSLWQSFRNTRSLYQKQRRTHQANLFLDKQEECGRICILHVNVACSVDTRARLFVSFELRGFILLN